MNETIAIVGAGSVGVNTAIFLNHFGFNVELIEAENDILKGAPQVTFVNHGDGFEYYKPLHRKTGRYCIDGSFVKGLMYPLEVFQTNICSPDNPIRFFVSQHSVKDINLNNFNKNAERMQAHFSKQFNGVSEVLGISKEEATKKFLREPSSFFRILNKEDYTDVNAIAGGCAGSSFGVNMAHYYAYLKAILKKKNISFHPESTIESIEKKGEKYLIHTTKKDLTANHIIICAGHQIPKLINRVKGTVFNSFSGTFFLNCMTFVRLPASKDPEILRKTRHINFTLQAEGGGMFACIVPPTETEDGLAALYYPSTQGSQLDMCCFDAKTNIGIPARWDDLIKNGLPAHDPAVKNTFQQTCKLYPFLRDYAEIVNANCRSVFNISSIGNNNGRDRRVRDISLSPILRSSDSKITVWAAPKWTNAEIVALLATDFILKKVGHTELPKNKLVQFGPSGLDVGEISKTMNFYDVPMDLNDALSFAEKQGVPARIVNKRFF